MTSELSNFATRFRAIIAESKSELWHDQFARLAVELFNLQFAANAAYRRVCVGQAMSPETISNWKQIPAVPTAAFKEFELTGLPPGQRTHVFHSSGTTQQRPSRHFHCAESLTTYEASLWPWFAANVLRPDHSAFSNWQLVILTPSLTAAPHSSLVHMFDTVRRKLGAPESAFRAHSSPDGTWTLDAKATAAALTQDSRRSTHDPILLLGTAFSFVHLLDQLADAGLFLKLPAGSRVMETGGYKGRSREVPKAELHQNITRRLGIEPQDIIGEYGMSELSSQAYATPLDATRHTQPEPRIFCFPPWARVQIISPETRREVADGETGLIRVFDLANVYSVLAVQTEDLGIRRGDGFESLGRAALAESRGCSLMAV